MKQTVRPALTRLSIALSALLLSACATSPPNYPQAPYISGTAPSIGSANPKAARLLQLRAEAMFAAGDPVGATAALVEREQDLASADAIARNRQEIWSGLMMRPLTPPDLKTLDQADRTTRGWIALARLAQAHATPQQYAAWQREYPQHPGNARLPDLMMATGGAVGTGTPFQIPPVGSGPTALLLPAHGPLGDAARMIREGYLSERRVMAVGGATPVDYDDTQADQSPAVFRQALDAGAGIAVGPLQKQAVAALAKQGAPPVPVLALNYLPSAASAPAGFLQFGLAPEDEARQAAADAYARGLRRAVALVPGDARGGRVLAAFQTQLEKLGGKVVASAQFARDTDDFSSMVRNLLDIDASVARDKAVADVIGRRPDFEPRRRQDIDFIFISGDKTQDRLMVSMFRYWHAVHLPIYSTADVNTGTGDHDLAGVHFCDAPWLLEPGPEWDAVRARIQQASRGLGIGYARLYALGMDAARLVARLRQGALQTGEEVTGYSGEFSVAGDGVVQRHLACAEVVAGAPPRSTDATILPVPGHHSAGVPLGVLPGQPASSAAGDTGR